MMEIYYLVQQISTAKPANDGFPGAVRSFIYGKAETILFSDSPYIARNDLTPYFVREYGYKRAQDARRSPAYKSPQNDRAWRTDVSLVRAWVRKDGRVFISPIPEG